MLRSSLVFLIMMCLVIPRAAEAWNPLGLFSTNTVAAETVTIASQNSQTVALLAATPSIDPTAKLTSDIEIVDGSALVAESGPLGTAADVAEEVLTSDQISLYVVKRGDTLAGIAKMFGVSTNTILWANDMAKGTALAEGKTLLILPVTGVKYTVKKGDTLASIAKKFGADTDDISRFNSISASSALSVGLEIIIPDGEMSAAPTPAKSSGSTGKISASYSGPTFAGYYIKPAACIRTQGTHGHNGIDLGCSVGTPIKAAASGTVIVATGIGGWNGGYGNYVVITHPNGSQTLYAHLSKVSVAPGMTVAQGEVIGYSGGRPGTFGAGKSTGAHLHFEVRGAKNPGSDGSWAN